MQNREIFLPVFNVLFGVIPVLYSLISTVGLLCIGLNGTVSFLPEADIQSLIPGGFQALIFIGILTNTFVLRLLSNPHFMRFSDIITYRRRASMNQLPDAQLNSLNKDALVILVSSMQSQINTLKDQLDYANAQLTDTSKQIELLTEQIRVMNQRQFGRKSEKASDEFDGQMTIFDFFNEAEFRSELPSVEPQIEEIVIHSYRHKRQLANVKKRLKDFPQGFSIIHCLKKN